MRTSAANLVVLIVIGHCSDIIQAFNEQVTICLDKVEADMAAVEVPNFVEKLVQDTRELNVPLIDKNYTFTQLLADKKSKIFNKCPNRDTRTACLQYITDIMDVALTADCHNDLMAELSPYHENYNEIRGNYPKFDEVNGYIHACYFWEEERDRMFETDNSVYFIKN